MPGYTMLHLYVTFTLQPTSMLVPRTKRESRRCKVFYRISSVCFAAISIFFRYIYNYFICLFLHQICMLKGKALLVKWSNRVFVKHSYIL